MLCGSTEVQQPTRQVFMRFLDTECTHYFKNVISFCFVPDLMCAQQMCFKCEAMDDLCVDLNSVENVHKCSGRTLQANLFIISSCPNYLRIRFMLFHATLVDTTQVSLAQVSGTEIGASTNNGQHQILSMSVEDHDFLDSLNFILMG